MDHYWKYWKASEIKKLDRPTQLSYVFDWKLSKAYNNICAGHKLIRRLKDLEKRASSLNKDLKQLHKRASSSNRDQKPLTNGRNKSRRKKAPSAPTVRETQNPNIIRIIYVPFLSGIFPPNWIGNNPFLYTTESMFNMFINASAAAGRNYGDGGWFNTNGNGHYIFQLLPLYQQGTTITIGMPDSNSNTLHSLASAADSIWYLNAASASNNALIDDKLEFDTADQLNFGFIDLSFLDS
jgi:hypothetical protein